MTAGRFGRTRAGCFGSFLLARACRSIREYQRLVFRPLAAFIMGRDEVDLMMKEFGTRSLRSGGATLIAATDVDSKVFQRHGGWRT
eukprot:8088986-Pyramimonas_sp.AAC.1